ncbi:MAG: DUF2075 domain-containing protein [Chitinophagaceae bacterium]|nr:DUF2075 domain-containing protein [Chitinophagaceae bacterium]
MNMNYELSIEISEQYNFNRSEISFKEIKENTWVKNQYPIVYFIQSDSINLAYVGESTNAINRIHNHLDNPERQKLNKITIIGSEKFNKSATLEIESKLIQYITAEGTYNLQNRNYGLTNHNYFQQPLYKDLFKVIWEKLVEKKIVTKSLSEIENSELFKYSPYKSLNNDQYKSIIDILKGLTSSSENKIFVSGSAGTGKTILATYLIKLLNTAEENEEPLEFNDDELIEYNLIKKFRNNYPKPKIGLVIAMTSLRESLKNVFKKIPGLKASMVLGPSDTFNLGEKYDLLIVDEAHRLRQYKNISWRGVFKKNNQKLGLGNDGNELDWIIEKSKNQIFFYDAAQSVKPSDIDASNFNTLLNDEKNKKIELKSQMRVKGGNDYIQFVDDLLKINRSELSIYQDKNYELIYFDSFTDFYEQMVEKEKSHKLCRIVSGYSWEWKSDPEKKPVPNLNAIDIEIDGLQFQWNQTTKDWINNPKDKDNPLKEIGCIHTVQGYDLNYTGVIFGKEINYNPVTKKIEIDSSKYFDDYGKNGASTEELKSFIINIYKTIMYRGIKGTFIYAYNKELREYFKHHVEIFKKELPFRIMHINDVKPYINAIPLVDISAAAGNFSDVQMHTELTWIEPPFNISAKKGYFVCKVTGESMNKKIPNGSYCLFKQDEGGSRNGKIVLVESTNFLDAEFGSGYTVKEYHSVRNIDSEQRSHVSITLKPLSSISDYKDIELTGDELMDFKVVGIFDRVLF